MSSIFDRLASGAGWAAFEADKRRRILAAQSTIRSLRKEIEQAYYRTGSVALDLYRAGRITQPELRQACEQATALQAQIAAAEREIESIRNETYAGPAYGTPYAGRVGPQPGAPYGDVCPKGHGALPPGARFCPVCGAQAVHVSPPAAGTFCPACGMALQPGARFCPRCGTSAPLPAPPPPVARATCPTCGTPLVPEAVFCPECGRPVARAEEAATPPAPSLVPEVPPQAREEAPVVPSAPAEAAGRCPNCGTSVVPEAVFCPECGQPVARTKAAVPPPPPPVPEAPSPAPEEILTPQSAPAEAASHCLYCGAGLVPEAISCPECGQTVAQGDETEVMPPSPPVVQQPLPVPEELIPVPAMAAQRCSNCGAALVPEAVFCPDCGQPVARSSDIGPETAGSG